MEKKTISDRIDSGIKRINRTTALISAGIILIMMLLTVIDVALRYLFRKPLIWNYDLQTVLIVIVTFLGIAYVQNLRGHINVDLLTNHLSSVDRLFFKLFANILFLIFTAIVAWQSGLHAYEAYILDDYVEGIVRIPIWPAKSAITLGSGMLSLTLALHIFENFKALVKIRKENTVVLAWNVKLIVSLAVWVFIAAVTYLFYEVQPAPVVIGGISVFLMLFLMFLGIPIAAATGFVTIWGIFILSGPNAALGVAGGKPFQYVLSYIMSVIPLFLMMGIFAGIAGFATDAYEAARRWLQSIPGGLVHATIAGSAMFAAASGASTAAVVTFTKLVLPELNKLGVQRSLALASICCSATLSTIIPPSMTLVTYALLTQQSVGKMLIAGVIPGLLHAAMYMVLVFVRCKVDPSLIPKSAPFTWKQKFEAIPRAWGLAFIVVVVMGGIYTGIFTPTEAAAMGTFAAFAAVLVMKKGTISAVKGAMLDSVTMTSSIVLIIITGMMFGNLLAISRLPVYLSEYIADLVVPPVIILIVIMAFYIVLGAFIDALSTLIITLPIVFPAMVALGYDPVWFGVLITITIEIALVSPPYGLNLFMMQATVPDLQMSELYRGVVWFIIFDILTLAIVIAFPQIALWLPNMMLGH